MAALNLFPSRVAFVNPDGTLTPEAYRALRIIYDRVGGAMGDSGTDVFGQVFGNASNAGEASSTLQSDVVQSLNAPDLVYADAVQPANFNTDFYGDVFQYQASSKDISGSVFADVFQPLSKDREAGVVTTLDVSGNGSIGGTLKLSAGTVALPSLYWSTDTTTGFYRIAANNNGYAVSGIKLLDFLSTGLAVTGTLSATGDITATKASGSQAVLNVVSGASKAYLAFQDVGSGRTAIGNDNNGGGTNNLISIGFGVVTAGVPANTVLSLNQAGAGAIAGSFTIGTFTLATRPGHAAGKMIYVSDGGAGAVYQGSNGAAWVNLG